MNFFFIYCSSSSSSSSDSDGNTDQEENQQNKSMCARLGIVDLIENFFCSFAVIFLTYSAVVESLLKNKTCL